MTKEKFIQHIEEITGLKRPCMLGDFEVWNKAVKTHRMDSPECPVCNARIKTKRANRARREHDQAMRDCGLVRCKDSLGKTIWE